MWEREGSEVLVMDSNLNFISCLLSDLVQVNKLSFFARWGACFLPCDIIDEFR